jgi:hypothetical protein
VTIDHNSVGTTIVSTAGSIKGLTLTTPPTAREDTGFDPATGFAQSGRLLLTAEGGAFPVLVWSSDTNGMPVGAPLLANNGGSFTSLKCRSVPKGSVWSLTY